MQDSGLISTEMQITCVRTIVSNILRQHHIETWPTKRISKIISNIEQCLALEPNANLVLCLEFLKYCEPQSRFYGSLFSCSELYKQYHTETINAFVRLFGDNNHPNAVWRQRLIALVRYTMPTLLKEYGINTCFQLSLQEIIDCLNNSHKIFASMYKEFFTYCKDELGYESYYSIEHAALRSLFKNQNLIISCFDLIFPEGHMRTHLTLECIHADIVQTLNKYHIYPKYTTSIRDIILEIEGLASSVSLNKIKVFLTYCEDELGYELFNTICSASGSCDDNAKEQVVREYFRLFDTH